MPRMGDKHTCTNAQMHMLRYQTQGINKQHSSALKEAKHGLKACMENSEIHAKHEAKSCNKASQICNKWPKS